MSKTLILCLIALATSALAQNASDEALILNQELTFLEEAANGVTVATATDEASSTSVASDAPTSSLEDEFFSTQDSVNSRAAAPNRPRPQRRRE